MTPIASSLIDHSPAALERDPIAPFQPELFDCRYYRVWYRTDQPPCREAAIRCDGPRDPNSPDTYAAFSAALNEQGIANVGVVTIIETDRAFLARYGLV